MDCRGAQLARIKQESEGTAWFAEKLVVTQDQLLVRDRWDHKLESQLKPRHERHPHSQNLI